MQISEKDGLDKIAATRVIRSTFVRLLKFFLASKFKFKSMSICSWAECVINNSLMSYKEVQLEHLRAAPTKLDDLKADVRHPLEKFNLGTEAYKRPIYVNASLSNESKGKLIDLLFEYVDCFAWSYEEMPGLDRTLVEHRLLTKIPSLHISNPQGE